jgi:hypothetical protein
MIMLYLAIYKIDTRLDFLILYDVPSNSVRAMYNLQQLI